MSLSNKQPDLQTLSPRASTVFKTNMFKQTNWGKKKNHLGRENPSVLLSVVMASNLNKKRRCGSLHANAFCGSLANAFLPVSPFVSFFKASFFPPQVAHSSHSHLLLQLHRSAICHFVMKESEKHSAKKPFFFR